MTRDEFIQCFQDEASKSLALIRRKVETCKAIPGVVLGEDFHPHKDGECMCIMGITVGKEGAKTFHFYVKPEIMQHGNVVQLADDLARQLSLEA